MATLFAPMSTLSAINWLKKECKSGDEMAVITALQNLLLAEDPDKAIPEALKEIERLVQLAISLELIDAFFNDFWNALFVCMTATHHDDPAQASAVRVLERLKGRKFGRVIYKRELVYLWEELPRIGEHFYTQFPEPIRVEGDEPLDMQAVRRRTNFSVFSARMVGAGLIDTPELAVKAVASALEREIEREDVRDYCVFLGAQWIILAGDSIFRYLLSEGKKPLRGAPRYKKRQAGPLYDKAHSELSIQRWYFWMRRFTALEVAKQPALLPENTREAAEQAVSRMGAILGEHALKGLEVLRVKNDDSDHDPESEQEPDYMSDSHF